MGGIDKDKCRDCGEAWKLMCEPVAHVEQETGRMLRLCHNCHRQRLDRERTERRRATSRDAAGGRDPVPVVE